MVFGWIRKHDGKESNQLPDIQRVGTFSRTDLSCFQGECGCLTPEKLQDSGLLSSRWLPSNGPSPVAKLPSELLPFFRMSGSLGSSHSMVGPAMDGERTATGLEVLTVLSPPPSQVHQTLTAAHTRSSTLGQPFATQHLTTAWLLTGQMAIP